MNKKIICDSIKNILESNKSYKFSIQFFLSGYSFIDHVSNNKTNDINFISNIKYFYNQLNSVFTKNNYDCDDDIKIIKQYIETFLIAEKLEG